MNAPAAPDRFRPFMMAAWFGLAGGLAEAALYALQRWGLHRYLRYNPDLLWMAPLSATALLLLPASVFFLIHRRRPVLQWRIPFAVYAFLALYGMTLFLSQVHDLARAALAAGAAVQLARLAGAHRSRVETVMRRTIPVFGCIVVVILAVRHGVPAVTEYRDRRKIAPAEAQHPNVLFLILDTVRALELSLYGYERPTSPALTRLAQHGVVFDHAISAAPWTLPAHAALFTGRDARELSADWRAPLDGRYPTLAEAFRANGYLTAGFAGNLVYTARSSGLSRGFLHYQDFPVTLPAILVNGAVIRHVVSTEWVMRLFGIHDLLERWKGPDEIHTVARYLGGLGERRWFAFVNLYDAHNPYLPPSPYDTLFGPPQPWSARNPWLRQTAPVTPAEAQVERNYYDGALAWVDNQIGTLVADLEARGLMRNTILVVVADHGEEFGEHGLLDHGNSIYLPALHVPLLIVGPQGIPAGRRVDGTVTTRNTAATILDLAGLPPSVGGTSLRATWMTPGPGAVAVSEVRKAPGLPDWFPVSRGGLSSAVTDDRQVIHGSHTPEEIFDLRADRLGATAARDSGDALAHLRSIVPAPPR
jgi:arylsulfatase A-like enzyme